MTILQLLAKLVGPADELVKFLRRAGDAVPDLAPTAEEWITKLQAAASQSNLVELAQALPKEIADIGRGEINPRSHPSDSA